MAKLNNLNSNKVQERKRQVRTYGTKTDLASTTTERGNTHWTDGSNVNIDGFLGVAGTMTVSGTLRVTGLLDVTGTFNGSGTNNLDGTNNLSGDNNLTGPTEISGSLDVTGPTTIDGVLTINGDTSITGLLEVTGDTTISGTLDIEGNTTVASDFEIIAGGLFKSGVTKIEPNGKATFGSFIIDPASPRLIQAPGGWLFSNGADSIGLAGSSTSSVNLNSDRAELDYGGLTSVVARAGAIDLNATKIWVNGDLESAGIARFPQVFIGSGFGTTISPTSLKIGSLPNTSVATANVHVDSNGYFYRVTT